MKKTINKVSYEMKHLVRIWDYYSPSCVQLDFSNYQYSYLN